MAPMDIPGFRIERLIAEGGVASVYSAVQESLGRRVALKILREFDNAEQSRRFLHEGHIIASLNHRNIITIHDIGRVEDIHYIAMEYLEGGTLSDEIAQGMKPAAILDLLDTLARCLAVVHSKGIIHRDIKPGNILFHVDRTPKLTDFGIAKDLGCDQDQTVVGGVIGTPSYVSPEQANGRPLDGRSDIYSLGIVFYEMLTGEQPYVEESHAETIVAHLRQPIPLLPQHRAFYQELLQRMIAKEPDERFATAGELASYVSGLRVGLHALATVTPVPSGSWHEPASDRESSEPVVHRAVDVPPSRDGAVPDEPALRQTPASALWRHVPGEAKILLGMVLVATIVGGFLLRYKTEIPPQPVPSPAVDQVTPVEAEKGSLFSEPASVVGVRDPSAFPEKDSSASEERTARASTPVSIPSDSRSQRNDTVRSEANDMIGQSPRPSAQREIVLAPLPIMAQPAAPPPLQPADDPVVAQLLAAGETALAEYRLTTPDDNSAYFYFRKVLKLAPDHAGALQGLVRIADQYESLARSEIVRGRYRAARIYRQRGLKIMPDHSGLRTLKVPQKRKYKPTEPTTPSASESDNIGGYFLEGF